MGAWLWSISAKMKGIQNELEPLKMHSPKTHVILHHTSFDSSAREGHHS